MELKKEVGLEKLGEIADNIRGRLAFDVEMYCGVNGRLIDFTLVRLWEFDVSSDDGRGSREEWLKAVKGFGVDNYYYRLKAWNFVGNVEGWDSGCCCGSCSDDGCGKLVDGLGLTVEVKVGLEDEDCFDVANVFNGLIGRLLGLGGRLRGG